MDHHFPMALGGHLVPGNIVSLCRKCNEIKLDKSPEYFYSERQILELQPYLEQQHELFSFKFDWDAWRADRKSYLLLVGVDAETAEVVLHNEDHPDFVGDGMDRLGVSISLGGVSKLPRTT